MALVLLEAWRSVATLLAMSIGTNRGTWWADPAFGSDLYLLRQTRKVTTKTVNDVRQELIRCTAWVKTDGLVKEIEGDRPAGRPHEIDYLVKAFRPDGTEEMVEGVWSAL